ncbi:MAG: hypothetical protein E6J83_08010 [Deltaproteobacteria bacterium]|nr:MAG: hypothetical protein E6J83_08010 [Deltaproteobacteria bacterium]
MRHTGRQLSLAFVVLALGLMGMGGFGGGRETGLPQREFRATFTDVDGTRVEATRVTAGGDTNLEGEIGRGRLRVPFDNIERIRFEPAGEDRDRIKAVVVLREGEPVTLLLRSSTTFYGQTPSGAYQIRARDLKSIDFAR